jgi:hypothetical protein
LFDCCFAINAVFRMFGDKRMTHEDTLSLYPPFPLRRQNAASLMLGLAQRTWGDEAYEKSVKPAIRRGIIDAELAYAAITGVELSDEAKQNIFGDQAILKPHMEQIYDFMNGELRERLKPFIYEPAGDG